MEKKCITCKYWEVFVKDEPCDECYPTNKLWASAVAEVDHLDKSGSICAPTGEAIERKCEVCEYDKVAIDKLPCRLCVRDFNYPSWEPKEQEIEKSCKNCKSQKLFFMREPCHSCDAASGWEPKPKKKSKWHKYPDEMPKNGRPLIVWNDNPDLAYEKLLTGVAFIKGSPGVFMWFSYKLDNVTHFRYMPKPPREYRK